MSLKYATIGLKTEHSCLYKCSFFQMDKMENNDLQNNARKNKD
jgi:hypothetical protein